MERPSDTIIASITQHVITNGKPPSCIILDQETVDYILNKEPDNIQTKHFIAGVEIVIDDRVE